MARLNTLDQVLFPVVERPVFASVADGAGERFVPIHNRTAHVSARIKQVVGVVGIDYQLVTNQTALNLGYQCCHAVFPTINAAAWEVGSVDAPSTGSQCTIDLYHKSTNLNLVVKLAANHLETFGPFVRVINSYNTARALSFEVGLLRLVCTNGMVLPQVEVRFTFVHSRIGNRNNFAFHVLSDDARIALDETYPKAIETVMKYRIPAAQIEPLVLLALQVKKPARATDDWDELLSTVRAMTKRYTGELGENAYAALNVMTDFASQPPVSRHMRRDRQSLQRLAGAWLADFSKTCAMPGFLIDAYLERKSAELEATPARNTKAT